MVKTTIVLEESERLLLVGALVEYMQKAYQVTESETLKTIHDVARRVAFKLDPDAFLVAEQRVGSLKTDWSTEQ